MRFVWILLFLVGCSGSDVKKAQEFADEGDYQSAYEVLLKQRNTDDVEVLFALALLEMNDAVEVETDVITSNKRAVSWLKKAANLGDKRSVRLLVDIYRQGDMEGIPKSEQLSNCLMAAIDSGGQLIDSFDKCLSGIN